MNLRPSFSLLFLLSLVIAGLTLAAKSAAAGPLPPTNPGTAIVVPGHAPGSRGEPASSAAEPYSVVQATVIPIATSAAGVALMVAGDQKNEDSLSILGFAGVMLGPSLGHLYTGDWRGAAIGTGLRVGGLGLALAGLLRAWGEDEEDHDTQGAVLALTGAASFVGGTLYGFIDAPDSARRANAKHSLLLTPSAIRGPRSTGWGAQLSLDF